MSIKFSRRDLLKAGAAAAATSMLPFGSVAAAPKMAGACAWAWPVLTLPTAGTAARIQIAS